MITKIVYARLFNLGNYENERIEIEITVEGDNYAPAFALARDAAESQHAQFQAEREAAEKRRYDEQQAEWARQRAEREAKSQQARPAGDKQPF